MSAGTSPAGSVATGIHWHGRGWYAARIVRGVQVYYYLGPKRLPLEEVKVKASPNLGEPLQFESVEGFTYAY